jgi:hypothetical protein
MPPSPITPLLSRLFPLCSALPRPFIFPPRHPHTSSYPLNSPQANHLARLACFPKNSFYSLPIGPTHFSSSSRHPSLFGVSLPSLSPAATSAGARLSYLSLAATSASAPLIYTRPPLPPPVPSTPTWFPPPSTSLPAVSSASALVLNLDRSGSPLIFSCP